MSRRTFLAIVGGIAAAGVLVVVGKNANRFNFGTPTGSSSVSLPPPAGPTPSIPAGADLDVAGQPPLVTPNDDFFRIDTTYAAPQLDTSTWNLRIHGMVSHELTLTWDELLALPLEESATTIACVSNDVGGDLIGNAIWLGYPIRLLLDQVAPDADADMVLSRGADGFTASTPLEALTDGRNAILAVAMNGQALSADHGFPVRMVVPGLYGYVSDTKWLEDLEVTRFDRASSYWTQRGWAERGPVKLESRIDVPNGSTTVSPGATVIAGVAWQPQTGIAGVEVQVDDGSWQQATLAPAISDDTWVQWRLPWTATPGSHTIRCRATNKHGEVQTQDEAPPAPDGATGWPEISVKVAG